MSYLSRHRPICTVLQDIAELAKSRGDDATILLCNEAIDYAQRMSAALVKYKTELDIKERHLNAAIEMWRLTKKELYEKIEEESK